MQQQNWWIFKGNGKPHQGIEKMPSPPIWREFKTEIPAELIYHPGRQFTGNASEVSRGETFQSREQEIMLVNAALYLRRPLLVTGKPGTGKSSLAYAVAHELKLGRVLTWPITSRSSLTEALYRYDAIGRLQEAQRKNEDPDIGQFIRLGPLGTALLPTELPQVLLIDEIDKSNIDLPNDLLNIFEAGEYEIPELTRLGKQYPKVKVLDHFGNQDITIRDGKVSCRAFPFVIITSNGERELPPPFLRRCIRLDIPVPDADKLDSIVAAHFGKDGQPTLEQRKALVEQFLSRRQKGGGDLATDQLLNAIYLTLQGINLDAAENTSESLKDAVWRYLNPQNLT